MFHYSDDDFEQGLYYKPKIQHKADAQRKKEGKKKAQSRGGKQLSADVPVDSPTIEKRTQHEYSVSSVL